MESHISYVRGPFRGRNPLWFDSCKRPPVISEHSVFAFWFVAYGRFECRSKMMSRIGMFQGAEKVQKGTNFRFWLWSFEVLYPGQPIFFAGNLVPQRFWEQNPLLCNGSHDHRNRRENGKVWGQNSLQIDYSTTTISGNITFLVLWHLRAN